MTDERTKYKIGETVELDLLPAESTGGIEQFSDKTIEEYYLGVEERAILLKDLVDYTPFLNEVFADFTELDEQISRAYLSAENKSMALSIYEHLLHNDLPDELQNLVNEKIAESYNPSIKDITGLDFDVTSGNFIDLDKRIEESESKNSDFKKKLLYSLMLTALVTKGIVDVTDIFGSKKNRVNPSENLDGIEYVVDEKSGNEKTNNHEEVMPEEELKKYISESTEKKEAAGAAKSGEGEVQPDGRSSSKVENSAPSESIYKGYDSRDLDKDLALLYQSFPDLKKFLKDNRVNVNDVTIMMHPAKQNSRNHYTEKSVNESIKILNEELKSASGWEDYAKIVYKIHESLEGKESKAYGDIFGYKTIGVGNLLYHPDSSDKYKKAHIREVRKVLGGITDKEYRKVYNGSVALSSNQIEDLHTHYITRKNGGADRIRSIVDKALEGTNLSREDIDPRLIITMLSADYQSQVSMKRNPEQIAHNLIVASKPSETPDGWRDRQQGALNIIDIYKNRTLLKTENSSDMKHRLRLANRAKFWKSVHIGDVTKPLSIRDAVDEVKVVIRDETFKGTTHVVIFGNIREGQQIEDIISSDKLKLDPSKKLNIYHVEDGKAVRLEQQRTGFKKTTVEKGQEDKTEFLKSGALSEKYKNGGRILGE